tara:strand:- start:69 stop:836 length:768 start_codon:yes stop_codon:yes gene_type:complete
MSWNAAVDFRKASPQEAQTRPCQDYGKVLKLNADVIVSAVADGQGKAQFSHIGAKTVVRSACNTIRTNALHFQSLVRNPNEGAAVIIFEALLDSVQESLKSAAADYLVSVDDLATSLIVFIACPSGLVAMKIGTGFIVYRQSGRQYEFMFRPGEKRTNTENQYITQPNARDNMEVAAQNGLTEFVCASTNALEPLSIRSDGYRPHTPFFRPLDQCTALARDDDELHSNIRAFLRSKNLTGKVDHDCTLMLGGYRN